MTYDGQEVFNVTYGDNGQLRWEGIEGVAKGEYGQEKITYRELAPGLFFINSLGESGFSVGQILDLNKMEVLAYNTYDGDGKRKELFRFGTIELQK